MTVPLHRARPGGDGIQPASAPVAERIADVIWVSKGLSNSYLVRTDEGRVIINTGMGFEAPVHKRNFDAVDASPVRYILFTQGHVDHVGGTDVFGEAGTQIVAQANNEAHQAYDGRIQPFRTARSAFAFGPTIAKAFAYVSELVGGAIPAQSHPVPTRTFVDRDAFELGGVRFELLATPGGETTDSMVVWLPQYRACFTGNLFGPLFPHVANLVTIRGDRYRDALAYVESLDRVRELHPELLITGHFDPIAGREEIDRHLEHLRNAMIHVHDAVVAGMNAGKDVWSLMREISVPAELEVGEGYGLTRWNVRAIWEHYAGWFHQRSTTELYPLSPSGVSADLVAAAGGPDPILARARVRLDGGEAVEAIRLAEVVLEPVPDHPAALAISLEAHERLEADSENFWLTAWLRHQITLLRARLATDSTP